jgi:mRNA-degrading endonuclease RelE of RelBE toxin-antitoxin system
MFRVRIHPDALVEIDALAAYHRKAILAALRRVLSRDPLSERRSRVKRMRGGFWPPFRLRVGEFRVYYDVDTARGEVLVLHVWEKGRSVTPRCVEPEENRARGRQRRPGRR